MKQPKPAFSLSDLGRLNINLSRREALGALAGAAGLGAFASLGRAQSRPPRPPVNSPPPKLGQTQGIVRWSQFVGPQFGPSYGIHYSGLIGMTQNSSDPKSFNVLDTYINQSGARTCGDYMRPDSRKQPAIGARNGWSEWPARQESRSGTHR